MSELPVPRPDAKEVIAEMIKREGLEKVTSSKIRAALKEKFKVDFSGYKKEVDSLTEEIITEQNGGQDSDSSDSDADISAPPEPENTEPPKSSTASGANSDSDSDHGIASSPAIKRKSAGRKRKAENEVDTSEMDIHSVVKSSTRRAAKQARKSLKSQAGFANRNNKDKNKGKGPRITPRTKLVWVSDAMMAVTERRYLMRCDIVKAFWNYSRTHELFDPKDKRFIILDETLSKIFKNKKRLQLFSMSKSFGSNVVDTDLMDEEYRIEAAEERERLMALQREKDRLESEGGAGDDENTRSSVPSASGNDTDGMDDAEDNENKGDQNGEEGDEEEDGGDAQDNQSDSDSDAD